MSSDDANARDLPSNDSPADDAIIPGATEPDPAEVGGSDDDPRDLAGRPINDPNVRESLDERLAEEEPDTPVRTGPDDAVQLVLGDDGADVDADQAEGDDDDDDQGELGAEEAAVHIEDAFR
ncbi:MAG TPA: hypothetical protein VMU65_11755 [Candidatus Saccharimonadales bacterium]|nr:hypothetical protein [Candidatus Saccharimonadales bacterium]